MDNNKTENQINGGIDFFDFIIFLWKMKYQFLIVFFIIFICLFFLIQFFRLNYNEIQSHHYIHKETNNEYSYLLLNEEVEEILNILPPAPTNSEFMKKLNIEFEENFDYYADEISKDLSLNNLNEDLKDTIISLVQIDEYEYDKNLQSTKISNKSKYYDHLENVDILKIKYVVNNHYRILIANTEKLFFPIMGNEIDAFEKLVEVRILEKKEQLNLTLSSQSELEESFEIIGQYIDQGFFWDNIVSLKNSTIQEAQLFQRLESEITTLELFRANMKHIIGSRYTGYNTLNFKSKISLSSPLTSNNFVLFGVSILLSLIATILFIYSYNRIKQKTENT